MRSSNDEAVDNPSPDQSFAQGECSSDCLDEETTR